MIKLLLFLASLVSSMFVILYSELTWQLIVVYGKKKLVLNFWFAILVLLLIYLTIHWLIKQFIYVSHLPNLWSQYRKRRSIRDVEFARGQAIMYALGGGYKVALGHMPCQHQTLSDLILMAIWHNQLQDIQKLDDILGEIQSLNRIPDGWMIWFRAYLLYERGKSDLATDTLLDAIESGVYSSQIVQAFVQYAKPSKHFKALLKHYGLLSRFVPEVDIIEKIQLGAVVYMDELISLKNFNALGDFMYTLPKKISKAKKLDYYRASQLLFQGQNNQLLSFFMLTSFEDRRLIPLLANMNLPLEKKIEVVSLGLKREPDNKNLLYLLSYLHAQSGSVDDTVKMLENAIYKSD